MSRDTIDSATPAKQTADQAFALNSADDNGVKESIATAATAKVYSGADLDGAEMDGTVGYLDNGLPRNFSVKRSSAAGSYVADSEVTFNGFHWYTHRPLSVAIVLPDADGGDELFTPQMFADGVSYPVTIAVDAQVDTSGAFEFGCGVAKEIDPPARWLWVNANGTLYLKLIDDDHITKWIVVGQTAVPAEAECLHAGTDVTDLEAVAKAK